MFIQIGQDLMYHLRQICSLLVSQPQTACVCVLPVFVCVKSQSSDLSPVFSQLSVTDHGHHADNVYNRVFRAHPDLVLINSQHTVLRIEIDKDVRSETATSWENEYVHCVAFQV